MGSIFGGGASAPTQVVAPPAPPAMPVADIKTAKLQTGTTTTLDKTKTNLKDRLKITRRPNQNTLNNDIGLGKI